VGLSVVVSPPVPAPSSLVQAVRIPTKTRGRRFLMALGESLNAYASRVLLNAAKRDVGRCRIV